MSTTTEEELVSLYEGLADDVESEEMALVDEELEGNEPFGVNNSLRRPPNTWRDGEKSLRTVPVVNAYELSTGRSIDREICESLVGMDAAINVLDDIIDTRDLEKKEKIDLTANAAFATLLGFGNIPAQHGGKIQRIVQNYLTRLFQIPQVERDAIAAMQTADSFKETVEPARFSYDYRSVDMDAFARIPGLTHDVDERTYERIVDDLRTHRARELVYKDIHDVERDLEDGDTTPVIVLLGQYEDPEKAADHLIQIHDEFQYSEESRGEYQQRLIALEGRPENLVATVDNKMESLQEYSEQEPITVQE